MAGVEEEDAVVGGALSDAVEVAFGQKVDCCFGERGADLVNRGARPPRYAPRAPIRLKLDRDRDGRSAGGAVEPSDRIGGRLAAVANGVETLPHRLPDLPHRGEDLLRCVGSRQPGLLFVEPVLKLALVSEEVELASRVAHDRVREIERQWLAEQREVGRVVAHVLMILL